MAEPFEANLASALAAGEPGAFERLYQALGTRLLRTARTMTGSMPDAEDALQEVFVALVKAGPRLAAVRDLETYVFAALRHAARRRAMRRDTAERVLRLAAVERAAGATGSPARESTVEWEPALAALPAEQREVIALKIDGELTFAQMAVLLGVSANTAASRYRYGIQKLRDALGGEKP